MSITFRALGPIDSIKTAARALRDVEAMLRDLIAAENTPINAADLVGDTLAASIVNSSLNQLSTFVPTLLLGGTPVTSYTAQFGTYEVVGVYVLFTIRLVVNVVGAGVGQVTIENLPFTSSNVGNDFYTGTIRGAGLNGLTTESLSMFIRLNSKQIVPQSFSTGTTANLTNTNIVAGASFIITGMYRKA